MGLLLTGVDQKERDNFNATRTLDKDLSVAEAAWDWFCEQHKPGTDLDLISLFNSAITQVVLQTTREDMLRSSHLVVWQVEHLWNLGEKVMTLEKLTKIILLCSLDLTMLPVQSSMVQLMTNNCLLMLIRLLKRIKMEGDAVEQEKSQANLYANAASAGSNKFKGGLGTSMINKTFNPTWASTLPQGHCINCGNMGCAVTRCPHPIWPGVVDYLKEIRRQTKEKKAKQSANTASTNSAPVATPSTPQAAYLIKLWDSEEFVALANIVELDWKLNPQTYSTSSSFRQTSHRKSPPRLPLQSAPPLAWRQINGGWRRATSAQTCKSQCMLARPAIGSSTLGHPFTSLLTRQNFLTFTSSSQSPSEASTTPSQSPTRWARFDSPLMPAPLLLYPGYS
jgi:hypothetical protein